MQRAITSLTVDQIMQERLRAGKLLEVHMSLPFTTEHLSVAELMTREVAVAGAHEKVKTATRHMLESNIRHLPVVDGRRKLVGLVSQRDLLGVSPERRLGEIMLRDLITVSPTTAAHEAAYLMWHHKIGCVPVTSAAGEVLGILTESDFVRFAYVLLGGRAPIDELEREESERG